MTADSTNLYQYITSGEFLETLTPAPSCIIWEQIPAAIESTATAITHTTWSTLGYDMRAEGEVIACITAQKHTMIMLDTITTATIRPLLAALPADAHVTFCEL
jgi:hypothetical protein